MTHTRRDGKPMCSAQTGWRYLDNGTREPATCRQVVGLGTVVAPDGTVLRACSAPGHRARVERQAARQHAVRGLVVPPCLCSGIPGSHPFKADGCNFGPGQFRFHARYE